MEKNEIKIVMVNEVVPARAVDDFYGEADSEYATSIIGLFQRAGVSVSSTQDLLEMGIYLTNAVKTPKTGYEIPKEIIKDHSFMLEDELKAFNQVKVIMLMGDVAKKSFNFIAKRTSGKNVIPSGATYKLRATSFFYGEVKVMPSYIMTGKNILIEKSKADMIVSDITSALDYLK
ncbi:uracil-DNA glycosylase [Vagococcus sp. BWB3-3]|uniref:Uracil-DNA glycosylase n=1 Tax=Vagococcus allomyrinae TaxID=2794353 RepID=A0A940PGX8_9ENTE|nr:uracil-DNA glycosylase [Vagococcus allomyrinae]MBP1043743.1 uracil-DNA glycosylase [Vagococcus allomyrinae]